MKTFIKCSSVLRIGFTNWNRKKRRFELKHVLQQHELLSIPDRETLLFI